MKRLRVLLFLTLLGLASIALATWQVRKLNLSRSVLGSDSPSGNHSIHRVNESVANQRVIAEGRVATYHGAQVTLSAEMVGQIQNLPVDENSFVKMGDLIAEIKVDDLKAALAEAKVRLSEIDAEIRLAELELTRYRRLHPAAAVSQQELDKAERNFELATAQRATAEATVTRLEKTVAKSIVNSPIDGVVLTRYVHPGEMAETGTKLLTIADTNRVRIEAEVDEFDAGRVKLGQTVRITAEGYPGESWQGVVEQIPEAVSEKTLRPLDPGRPSDARVLNVKIAFKEPAPLKLGQRVQIEIGVSQ